ncbi:MAG TPA: M20/M25/M40 family metallo-hydrolase [Verrucomicrobiae bacterium]
MQLQPQINPKTVQATAEELLPEALRFLEEMVRINSFTANREGVNRVGKLIAKRFEVLGFTAEFVPSINPAYGEHLVLRRPGQGAKTIGLVTHLDTVFPPEEEQQNQFFWRPEGERIYGPGTMDIKGGTAMIFLVLSTLQRLCPGIFEAVNWKVLANSSEEVLSHDFGEVCLRHLGPNAMGALIFECEGRAGNTAALVVARKGRAVFRVRIIGRGAHAGGRHHHGANAIVQMGETVQKIATLTDYKRELTFNVGTVKGGSVTNRVPHEAVAEVEMRAFEKEVYDAGKNSILALNGPGTVRAAEDGLPCQIEVKVLHESSPWPENQGSQQLFAIFQEAGRSIGQIVVPQRRGGLSDGNLICQAVPTLDGLGPWGENDHCSERSEDGTKDQEYVEVGTFVPKAVLNVMAIAEMWRRSASARD